jgi:hypothetical protein
VEQFFKCDNCGARAEIVVTKNMAAIDAVLSLRPIPQTRNWTDETVESLLAENVAHGIGGS